MEQEPIAAAHHLDAVRDETTGLVLARIDLPIFLRPMKAEQDFGHGAIALATKSRIERTEREDVESAQLRRQGAEVRARRSSFEGSPEATGGVSTQLEKSIQRQRDSVEGGSLGRRVGQPELVSDAAGFPEAMPSIDRMPQIEAGQMRQRHDGFCQVIIVMLRGQKDRLWLKARNPEQGLPIR